MIDVPNSLIGAMGMLNRACKEKQYFWGIKKYCWEDFYQIEVSSHNFDNRPSLHANVDLIDDAIAKMVEHIELVN